MELRKLAIAVAAALSLASANAGPRSNIVSAPDPGGIYYEVGNESKGVFQSLDSRTVRSITINPAKKTLILISAGQSLAANTGTGSYSPSNGSVLDNFNPVTGELYAAANPLLGTTGSQNNFVTQLGDTFITNGIFDRVIIVPCALSGTSISQWVGPVSSPEPGFFQRTILSAINKLKARGITPSTTGTTWAVLWNQGESDNQIGTSQASYVAGFNSMFGVVNAAIPNVRWFVAKETWINGTVSATIQAAQLSLINNIQIFSAGNMDALDATNRQGDNTHLNATGQANAAALVYNAMHASGAPF